MNSSFQNELRTLTTPIDQNMVQRMLFEYTPNFKKTKKLIKPFY